MLYGFSQTGKNKTLIIKSEDLSNTLLRPDESLLITFNKNLLYNILIYSLLFYFYILLLTFVHAYSIIHNVFVDIYFHILNAVSSNDNNITAFTPIYVILLPLIAIWMGLVFNFDFIHLIYYLS